MRACGGVQIPAVHAALFRSLSDVWFGFHFYAFWLNGYKKTKEIGNGLTDPLKRERRLKRPAQ